MARAFEFNTIIRFFTSSSPFADFRIIVSTNSGCLLYKPSKGDLGMQGGFFATDIIPSFISFISSDRFIIVQKVKAFLFEITEETSTIIREFEGHTPIIAALPSSNRNQFALVEESGKISICDINF